jgi:basic amino acid/polyamine antiporter, APA family
MLTAKETINVASRPPGNISGASGSTAELRRVLRMRDLVMLVIGTVIGSGIFLVPGAVLRPVGGSVPAALLVWLTGGVLSLLGALTYGELTALHPEAGGLYIFIKDCFGRLPAFLYGWTLFFVISSGSVATLAVAFSNYLSEFLPLSAPLAKVVSVAMVAVIAVVNVRGTRQSADLQNVTTTIKVAAIVAMGIALLWLGKHPVFSSGPNHVAVSAGSLLSGFGLAMISVLWAYEGWQYATFSAGESINPQRDFPLAFLIGSAGLIGIYLLANFGYLAALGSEGVAGSNRVAMTAVTAVGNPNLARIVGLAILISIFSAANSIILTAPRVYYAMAKDGIFFHRLAEVHPRFGTPAFAVVTAAVWAAVLAASGTFEQLLTYVVFVGWIFYGLAAASIFIYRKRTPDTVRTYRTPGYPVTPILFIASAVALVSNTIATQPGRSALGLGIVALGIPAYLVWRSKHPRRPDAQESARSITLKP